MVCAWGLEEEFLDLYWDEEKEEFIENRNAASAAGRLPDGQEELTPVEVGCCFLLPESKGKGGGRGFTDYLGV